VWRTGFGRGYGPVVMMMTTMMMTIIIIMIMIVRRVIEGLRAPFSVVLIK